MYFHVFQSVWFTFSYLSFAFFASSRLAAFEFHQDPTPLRFAPRAWRVEWGTGQDDRTVADMRISIARTTLAAATLSAAVGVQAQTLDEESVAALERFYHHFNGDEWSVRSGWLEDDRPACEWHGVVCRQGSDGNLYIERLMLAGNNLSGRWHESHIADWVDYRIDLSGNSIDGQLATVPCQLGYLDLSDNDISGPLPEKDNVGPCELFHLDLARNDFAGDVPESWKGFLIDRIDVSGNQLSGNANHLTLAVRSHINLADNQFSGDLADIRVDHLLDKAGENWPGGGVNLCWNQLSSADEQVLARVAEYHVAADDFIGCLGRERLPLGTEVSGSWFDPERSGEGAAVQLLPDNGSLHYTFGFDNQGRQHWLIGTGPTTAFTLHWPVVGSLRGSFGEGRVEQPSWPISYPSAGNGPNWRMDRTGENSFRLQRNYIDCSDCPEPVIQPIVANSEGDQLDYTRLSSIAGTRCDNQQPHQWISGAWYDPQRSGEGFLVEVLEDGSGLVYWFTFRPDDSKHQAWMIGTGEFDAQTLMIDDLIQPTGGTWGEDFDPDAIELEHWGTLELDFTGPDNGHVYYDSVKADYGSGNYPLQRLSRVRMADCE
jgi:hypothetical protein